MDRRREGAGAPDPRRERTRDGHERRLHRRRATWWRYPRLRHHLGAHHRPDALRGGAPAAHPHRLATGEAVTTGFPAPSASKIGNLIVNPGSSTPGSLETYIREWRWWA